VHYPIPVYAQKGLAQFGYRKGDFPVSDRQADRVVTLPVDQHLTREQQDIALDAVARFFQ
jgi:dTDP-4-amino-4,6-dideoxygalactose transaminase